MKKKILLTGGGTGGHFFPLLAVADVILELTRTAPPEMYYIGPPNPFEDDLRLRGIKVYHIAASKLRRYFDWQNIIDIPKFIFSLIQSLFFVYRIMPDIIFSKGGTGSLPTVLAGKFYFIPIVIHESDAIPGLQNRLAAHLAKRIGVSFKKAAEFFPREKTALIGNPVRAEILQGIYLDHKQSKINLGFDPDQPLILILGGSQGAATLNSFIWDNLTKLLKEIQIYHQTGPAKDENINLEKLGDEEKNRYRYKNFLTAPEMKQALAAADLVLARAGAGSIFEIAALGKPAILIPLPTAAGNHQLFNAYEYAETGAAIVIEEDNFKPSIVLNQIKTIIDNPKKMEEMAAAAKSFAKPRAAKIIAEEILKFGL